MLVLALTFAQRYDEATALADGVVAAAEAAGNPTVLHGALTAYFMANLDRDPPGALAALNRALPIARDLGVNRGHTPAMIARAEAAHGDSRVAFDACHQSLLAYAGSGDLAGAATPLTVLACLLHRIGRDEAAAVVAGCGDNPVIIASYPDLAASIEHLRQTLDADTFDALADRGRAMETTAKFRYALEQIDQARDAIGEAP